MTRQEAEWTPEHRATGGRSTETKAALKTSELIAFVLAVVGVLVAAALVDVPDAGGIGARQGWQMVTALTIGYMISRGLAKSGSREPYADQGDR